LIDNLPEIRTIIDESADINVSEKVAMQKLIGPPDQHVAD